jgi:mannosyltransferase
VVSVYDFTYERYRDGLARRVHSTQKLRSIRRADRVLCISAATRRDVLQHCPDVDPAKVQVVHLGVDGDAYFPEPDPAADGAARHQVLFVGQRTGYKRFDLAIEALRQSPRLSLGIVGPALDDSERASLTRHLGTRWTEIGPVPSRELRRRYSSAFAFIFPSDYEGFGLPVLEAMACGCPVLAADNSSLPEVGGDAALYPSTQDAQAYAHQLQRLEGSALREQLVAAGLQRARQFPWAKTLQQTVALYR